MKDDVSRQVAAAARIAVAAFAAASAGALAASMIPFVLLRIPLVALLAAPPAPLLAFSTAFSAAVGVPAFAAIGTLVRPSRGVYAAVAAAMGAVVVPVATFAVWHRAPFAGAGVYDILWLGIVQGVPGGALAGLVAHAVMSFGADER